MSAKPSYIPTKADINRIKSIPFKRSALLTPSQQQLQAQILSLPPYTQLPAPPQQLQLPAPPPTPTQQPITVNFSGFNPMMPMEYGRGVTPIIEEIIDDEILAALPEDKQEDYKNIKMNEAIDQKINKSDVSKTLNLTEDEITALNEETKARGQGRQWGTKHSNTLKEPQDKYKGNNFYKENYKKGIEKQLKNTKLTTEEKAELNRLLGLINGF